MSICYLSFYVYETRATTTRMMLSNFNLIPNINFPFHTSRIQVQYILSDGSILVQKDSKKDNNKNSYRRMIVVNQQDLQQATTIQVPAQQRIITQPASNGNVETKNLMATTSSVSHRQQAITPIGPLTLTAEEYNELLQRRMERQAQAEAVAAAEAQQRAQQEAQQRAQQDAVRRAQQSSQIHNQQMHDHQNIAVQVQKIVQSLEEDVDGKKEDHDDIEMQLIAPKLEVTEAIQSQSHNEGQSSDQPQTKHGGTEGKSAAGRPFSCEQCGKKFLLKHHLTTHARVHTGNPICSLISDRFLLTFSNFPGERPHVCIHCGKDFAHKHCLNTHLLLHSTER